MSKTTPDSPYVASIKSILKESGFGCHGNICKPKVEYDLDLQINFRNQWCRPLHDVGLLIKDRDGEWLLTDDLHHFFEGLMEIFQEFLEEELRDLPGNAEERIRAAFVEKIVPKTLDWAQCDKFLVAVDPARSANVRRPIRSCAAPR